MISKMEHQWLIKKELDRFVQRFLIQINPLFMHKHYISGKDASNGYKKITNEYTRGLRKTSSIKE